ncbi:hypothetical protein [Streptomyces sp. NPDC006355]|uniref:hypothetical protein n=1 Tax=Streptomyces sp. NPDC006355 TaxID=3156758 RepID=UPI0033A3A6F3
MTHAFRAHLSPRAGRRTWWVEIFPAYQHAGHGVWMDDFDGGRVVGLDTGLPVESSLTSAHLDAATAAAEKALPLAGWHLDGAPGDWSGSRDTGDLVHFVERIPSAPGNSASAPEDGSLRRDGNRWISSTPRISRHPSPAYLTAGAAWRLDLYQDLTLPEGYTREALERITYLTGSYTAEGVIVSDRQARELGEIARVLAAEHAEDLELSDFGDEAWGVAGVLRALETGHS